MWQFTEDETAELTEPQLVCECESSSSVMDLRFLDEQNVVGSFSNGCVAIFRYKSMMKVGVYVYLEITVSMLGLCTNHCSATRCCVVGNGR